VRVVRRDFALTLARSDHEVGEGNHFGSREYFLFFLGHERTNEITIRKMSNCLAGLREGSCHVAARINPQDSEM
jgi:hypothetical protein